MVSPVYKRLADFDAIPISVIQKSAPCDHTKEPLELVMLDNGLDESGYRTSISKTSSSLSAATSTGSTTGWWSSAARPG
jgi:hypothetical protein